MLLVTGHSRLAELFHLFEIYEIEEGLNHHWKEASHFLPILESLLELHDIEIRNYTHTKVIQSLQLFCKSWTCRNQETLEQANYLLASKT